MARLTTPTTQRPSSTTNGVSSEPHLRQLTLGTLVPRPVTPELPIDQGQRQSKLGQFMTPGHVASFLASMFTPSKFDSVSILDPGAGEGALTVALLDQISRANAHPTSLSVTAYELDPLLAARYMANTCELEGEQSPEVELVNDDFILAGVAEVARGFRPFTHAIMNPPYKKINNDSVYRRELRTVGIETVNLYSAFLALGIELLAPGGQLVAIVPRSFCNGPYYRSLRDLILQKTAIRRMHLFDARDKAFEGEGVLQENVIIHLERDVAQAEVVISTSTDDRFADLEFTTYPFSEIVLDDDPEHFLHIPTKAANLSHQSLPGLAFRLKDLDLEVSTGPVVDFRLREYLRQEFGDGLAPLLYPSHTANEQLNWPVVGGKKPNAIVADAETIKWLYPVGNYVAVRRFSSKEERRRIVATHIDGNLFPNVEWLGFENHLNVFHRRRQGLSTSLAAGIATLLNSSVFEEMFRRFNGHTQVNATDLRAMRYPSLDILHQLGEATLLNPSMSLQMRDELVGRAIG